MFNLRPYKLTALREWNLRMSRFETPEIFDTVIQHVLEYQGFDCSESVPEPRSVYSVSKLYEQLEAFDPSKSVIVNINDKHVQRGIAFAFKCFAKDRQQDYLNSLTYYDESIISNWKASAGLTAFGSTKREAFSRGTLSVERILDGSRRPEPCIALTRTQKKGKTRLVWGYPMSMTLLEGSFAKVLLSVFKKGSTPMAFATTAKNLGLQILSSSNNNRYFYSLDASQYDGTIQKEIIHVCFGIIRTWFNLDEEYSHGKSNGEVLSLIENYFTHTSIVMPTVSDEKFQGILHTGKRHGVPSGSYFTQLIDSIANVIILGTMASRFGFQTNSNDCQVLGDDLLFFTDSHLDIVDLAKYAKETFGMKVNALKSVQGRSDESIPFLGREWVDGLPNRSSVKAIAKMLSPENFRKYHDARREGKLVVLSYNLSALQDVGLIPDLHGWSSRYNSLEDVSLNAEKLSGYFRYVLTHTDHVDFSSTSGSINMLKVLL